jgi:hypothetical protein
MESFLLVRYPQPALRPMEDAYNYHSNCRIKIECTFGNIVMRWGIFWRAVQFVDVAQVGLIAVASSGLVHYFMIDERLEEDVVYIRNFSTSRNLQDAAEDNETTANNDSETAAAIVSDNNEPKPARPFTSNVWSREMGEVIRRSICLSLEESAGYTRPRQSGFKVNH